MKKPLLQTISQLPNAQKSAQPISIKPQLATLTAQAPISNDWLHEVKYDGYRIIAVIKNGEVKLYSRNKHDWTHKLPILVTALKYIKFNCILDGELVALIDGISNFQLLQNTLSTENHGNLQYKIFDILYCEGYDLTRIPLIDRKKILAVTLKGMSNKKNIFSATEYIIGQGPLVFKQSCKLHLEGIISKHLYSTYEERRSKSWLKVKCVHEQEFVIAGYTPPKGSRKLFGSLLLGYYKNKHLIYCGHVGTGFTQKSLAELFDKMKNLTQSQSPFDTLPDELNIQGVTWLKPKLVGEIRFAERTIDGILRAPSFLGLRLDKTSKEVKQEMEIPLSHAENIIKVTGHVTKQQMADYYEKISAYIIPYLKDRPLSLLRCPASGKDCFVQKNSTSKDLQSLSKIVIKEKTTTTHYASVKNASDLKHLAQDSVLELHPWGARKDQIEKPDMITFDLDPAPDVKWSMVIKAAFYLHDFLDSLGLKNFVKTSGGKGLHIVVPITRKYIWPEIKSFAQNIAIILSQEHPDLFIANMSKGKRVGKIFIDYLRNGRGATTVAAYSLRARMDAPISVPISWTELKKIKSAAQFNISNIDKRLAKLKSDPWAEFFKCKQGITKKMMLAVE